MADVAERPAAQFVALDKRIGQRQLFGNVKQRRRRRTRGGAPLAQNGQPFFVRPQTGRIIRAFGGQPRQITQGNAVLERVA
jgi:hypothetical protein